MQTFAGLINLNQISNLADVLGFKLASYLGDFRSTLSACQNSGFLAPYALSPEENEPKFYILLLKLAPTYCRTCRDCPLICALRSNIDLQNVNHVQLRQ